MLLLVFDMASGPFLEVDISCLFLYNKKEHFATGKGPAMSAHKKLEILQSSDTKPSDRRRDRAARWRTPFDRAMPGSQTGRAREVPTPRAHSLATEEDPEVRSPSSRAELSSPNSRDRLTDLICQLTCELRHLGELFENRIDDSPYLDIQGAARFLRVSKASVEYYAKRQRLLPYHVVGKTLVFHHDDLIKFMKRFRRPGVDG